VFNWDDTKSGIFPFPNQRLTITLDSEDQIENRGKRTGVDYYTDFPVRLSINRPIHIDTLVSLFGYPVSWNTPSAPRPIERIHTIAVWSAASLVQGSPGKDACKFRNLVARLSICIGPGHEPYERLLHTLYTMGHLLPTDMTKYGGQSWTIFVAQDPVAINALVMRVSVVIHSHTTDLNALVLPNQQLSVFVIYHPCLFLTINIHFHVSRTEFQAVMMEIASVYGRAWEKIKNKMKLMVGKDFFELVGGTICETGNDDSPRALEISLKGRLLYMPETGSFVIHIIERNETTGQSTVIFHQPFVKDHKCM
jgi:hypothetical protein